MLDFATKAAGCTVFSKIDLWKGYQQVPCQPRGCAEDRHHHTHRPVSNTRRCPLASETLGCPSSVMDRAIRDSTVKRDDEVVRHPHRLTQDLFSLVSEKVSFIPEDNFTTIIELFGQTFTNVELLRQSWIVSKVTPPGSELQLVPGWTTSPRGARRPRVTGPASPTGERAHHQRRKVRRGRHQSCSGSFRQTLFR
jgi:hypothetical protein